MKKAFFLIVTGLLLTSCVTKKRFTELSNKYDRLRNTNSGLIRKNDQLLKDKSQLENEVELLKSSKMELTNQSKKLKSEIDAVNQKYNSLQNSYDLLSSKSSSEIGKKAKENRALLEKLEAKETSLFEQEANLAKLTSALEARSKRIKDLEALIASKEAAMKELKMAISNALKGFEGKGLTVEHRNGKVYVSMENKLLFNSGQWTVGAKGKSAVVELSRVLVENPTIDVLIEGHTDNDPYTARGVMKDNWDLSVKRATAIVRILQQNKVSAKQITAAGRSEFVPIASNDTSAGKAKNRRIEIVLSPNLDEVNKLLNQ